MSELARQIEALLFLSPEPLPVVTLCEVTDEDGGRIRVGDQADVRLVTGEQARGTAPQGRPGVAEGLKHTRAGENDACGDEIPGNNAQEVGTHLQHVRFIGECAYEPLRLELA